MELCEARPTDGWCNAATVHSGSASIATPRDVYTRLAPGTSSSAAVGAVYPPVYSTNYILRASRHRRAAPAAAGEFSRRGRSRTATASWTEARVGPYIRYMLMRLAPPLLKTYM